MKDGLIRIGAAVPSVRIADVSYNLNQIKAAIDKAEAASVRVLAFPELSVTGATCSDLFYQNKLLKAAEKAAADVYEYIQDKDMAVILGMPYAYKGKLYNCLAFLAKDILTLNADNSYTGEDVPIAVGAIEGLLTASALYECSTMPALRIYAEQGDCLFASSREAITAAESGATLIVNCSSFPELVSRRKFLEDTLRVDSGRLHCAYLNVNAGFGESSTDVSYAGGAYVYENGKQLTRLKVYEDGLCYTEIDVQLLENSRMSDELFTLQDNPFNICEFELTEKETPVSRRIDPAPFIPENTDKRAERMEELFDIQKHGLMRRLTHIHAKTAVIGVSGGLDSTLALLAAHKAFTALGLDTKGIQAITMPCFGTTGRTRSNAEKLAELLNLSFREVPIAASVEQHFRDIGQDKDNHDVTFENAQARERTQVLMDIANQCGGIVIGTGDLSELALGWATYNGDHMSMYGVNASLPKTLIRHMVWHEAQTCGNEDLKAVLIDVLETPVSPELLPPKDNEIAQKTEDLVGPYELHDFFIYNFLHNHFEPAKIRRLANIAFKDVYDDATITKWLKTFCRRFFNMQFKRSCLPDGVGVGSVSVSPRGFFSMPSDASNALWQTDEDYN